MNGMFQALDKKVISGVMWGIRKSEMAIQNCDLEVIRSPGQF